MELSRELSLCETFAPGNFHPQERKFHGTIALLTFVPANFCSLLAKTLTKVHYYSAYMPVESKLATHRRCVQTMSRHHTVASTNRTVTQIN